MPLSWNEIKTRALGFSRKWDGEASERAEAQSFWNDFFDVFGINRRRVAVFEKSVNLTRKNEKAKRGRIDAFWKGVLLIEHKSEGVDLERAFTQATDYFENLPERDLPRYILVSDFARFKLYDLEADTQTEFKLADLHKQVKHFGFIAGYHTQEIKPQDPVNIKAAEQMGKLHDQLTASGYSGHALELLLVRLLFCLFADDTGIFQPAQSLRMWLDERTAPDGSDLGPQLAQLFQVLDQASDKRQKNLDEQLNAFPHVNGKLFQEMLPMASFDAKMRDTLLDCCRLDWAAISPAIFGALFQSIMDDKARRNLGAHYTSEENIIKLIKPLFLDELWAEFNKIKNNRNKLFDFQKKLRTLTFFDPACGCGNFLVITYREIRMLELEVLRSFRTLDPRGQEMLRFTQVDVDQFYGIEIEEFPAQIAQVALWLIDHQMNMLFSEEFGIYFARIPLVTTPHIVHDNALRIDWNDVLTAERCSYVMGNPPFVGAKFMDDAQRDDTRIVFAGIENAGLLDFVSAWYVKAARYIKATTSAVYFSEAMAQISPLPPGEGPGVRDIQPSSTFIKPKLPEDIKTYARELRAKSTDAEQLLWQCLRNRRMNERKFRRQHPVGRYILDFYCDELKLAIELDGGQHNEDAGKAHDQARTDALRSLGITVLRFWNNDMLAATESVLESIWLATQVVSDASSASLAPSPQPLSRGERGLSTRCAFVSTNSITQGEQVGVLWGWLLAQGVNIHFAHRTFRWNNEATGKAAVHCVIIGFGLHDLPNKIIYDYEDIDGDAHPVAANNINPYLVDAPDVVLAKNSTPICAVPTIHFGNQPIDGGHFILSTDEKSILLSEEPGAEKYIRPYVGAEEFINAIPRYCLWLKDITPSVIRAMPVLMKHVEAVKKFRLESKREATRDLAATPTQFAYISHKDIPYLLIPSVSSERRNFIPIGFMPKDVIASNLCLIIPGAGLLHFGVLSSSMHNAWMRNTCGRLKSDYRYSASIVYNNFPWPMDVTATQKQKIETAAQGVLDVRAAFQLPSPTGRGAGGEGGGKTASLADLYDPLTMPPALVKAHQQLDAAVDAAYGKKNFKNDAERVAFLFALYQQYTSLLPVEKTPARKGRKKT